MVGGTEKSSSVVQPTGLQLLIVPGQGSDAKSAEPENGLPHGVKNTKIKNILKLKRRKQMGKKKSKSNVQQHLVKEGSRLKLKSGEFARSEEKIKGMTVMVKVYNNKTSAVRNIPVGQILEVVRY